MELTDIRMKITRVPNMVDVSFRIDEDSLRELTEALREIALCYSPREGSTGAKWLSDLRRLGIDLAEAQQKNV